MNLINDVISFQFNYNKFKVFCTSNFFDGTDYKYVIYDIVNTRGESLPEEEFCDLRDEIREQLRRNANLHQYFVEMLKLEMHKQNG